MKKIILLLIVGSCAFSLQAATRVDAGAAGTDSAKIARKIKDLNEDLANLKSQLAEVQKKIPIDSVNLENLLSKSHDAQLDSKKAAKDAVGGDVGDAKKAEKEAKRAADATDDAHDAQSLLDDDRKTLKKLNKRIEKTQEKLNKLQTQ